MISARDIRTAQYINAIARKRMAQGGLAMSDETAALETVRAELERYKEVNAELEDELRRYQEENSALRAQVYEARLKAVADVVDKHKDAAA